MIRDYWLEKEMVKEQVELKMKGTICLRTHAEIARKEE